MNVIKHMRDGGDLEVLEKLQELQKILREKERDLEDLDALHQTLIVRERKSNDELQDARKELINVNPLISLLFFSLLVVPFFPFYVLMQINFLCIVNTQKQGDLSCTLNVPI